jgi:DNA-binding MarR family transcriptional regulator
MMLGMARGASVPSPQDAQPFEAVGFALSSLGFAVAARFRERLAPLDLEPRDFALLRAVGAAEGRSQNAIAEQLHIPASRMVAFIDSMQDRGLIERRAQPGDRRAHALYLTAAGRELLAEAFAVASGFERELCARLSAADRKRLLALLSEVREQLGLPEGVHAAQLSPDSR